MGLIKMFKDKSNSYLKTNYTKNPSGITMIQPTDYDRKFFVKIFYSTVDIDDKEQSITTNTVYIDTRNGNLILSSLTSRDPAWNSSSTIYEMTYDFFYHYVKRNSFNNKESKKKKSRSNFDIDLGNERYCELMRDSFREWLLKNNIT